MIINNIKVDFKNMSATNDEGLAWDLIYIRDHLHCKEKDTKNEFNRTYAEFHNAYIDYLAEELLKEDT